MAENKIKSIYIDPGCPWQNGYAESFNSRFRIECLDRELPYSLSESQVVFADWRDYYNNIRPHRSRGLQSPSQFARIGRDTFSASISWPITIIPTACNKPRV